MDLTNYNSSAQALPPNEEGGDGKLPDGKYPVECVGLKLDETSGGYKFVEFEYVIIGDRYAKKHVWQKTWLYGPQEPDDKKKQMGEMGERDRDKIAAAIGLSKLNNCNDAIGKFMVLTLTTKGDWQNVTGVESYGAHNGQQPERTQMQQPNHQQPPTGVTPSPSHASAAQGQAEEIPF